MGDRHAGAFRGERLSLALGQPIVIERGSLPAASASATDGYTLSTLLAVSRCRRKPVIKATNIKTE
jgi:hypothetical protein